MVMLSLVLTRYDPSNPVVCYDGELRSDLYKKVSVHSININILGGIIIRA